jgi:hypothetical protein
MGVVLALALFVASILLASELGSELVTLGTVGADGATSETRLWIVDDGGSAWLRAGVPESGWLLRIQANPAVVVERGGTTTSFRAVPVSDPILRDRIHRLMREKYGWADRWISIIRDGGASVPVRLDPRAAP